jgi:hypothetical protein
MAFNERKYVIVLIIEKLTEYHKQSIFLCFEYSFDKG